MSMCVYRNVMTPLYYAYVLAMSDSFCRLITLRPFDQPRSRGLSSSRREDERPWERGCRLITLTGNAVETVCRLRQLLLTTFGWNPIKCLVLCLAVWLHGTLHEMK